MPLFKSDDDQQNRETSLHERFELLPLDRFEIKDGLLQNYLMGERVELAIEAGSRSPNGNLVNWRTKHRLSAIRFGFTERSIQTVRRQRGFVPVASAIAEHSSANGDEHLIK